MKAGHIVLIILAVCAIIGTTIYFVFYHSNSGSNSGSDPSSVPNVEYKETFRQYRRREKYTEKEEKEENRYKIQKKKDQEDAISRGEQFRKFEETYNKDNENFLNLRGITMQNIIDAADALEELIDFKSTHDINSWLYNRYYYDLIGEYQSSPYNVIDNVKTPTIDWLTEVDPEWTFSKLYTDISPEPTSNKDMQNHGKCASKKDTDYQGDWSKCVYTEMDPFIHNELARDGIPPGIFLESDYEQSKEFCEIENKLIDTYWDLMGKLSELESPIASILLKDLLNLYMNAKDSPYKLEGKLEDDTDFVMFASGEKPALIYPNSLLEGDIRLKGVIDKNKNYYSDKPNVFLKVICKDEDGNVSNVCNENTVKNIYFYKHGLKHNFNIGEIWKGTRVFTLKAEHDIDDYIENGENKQFILQEYEFTPEDFKNLIFEWVQNTKNESKKTKNEDCDNKKELDALMMPLSSRLKEYNLEYSGN